MKNWRLFLSVFLCSFLWSQMAYALSSDEGIRRVRAHLLIEDFPSALEEAEQLFQSYPQSSQVLQVLIEALAASGEEERALKSWAQLQEQDPEISHHRNLLEELSWGVLQKNLNSSQYQVRLSALIGAYLTRDVKAVPILIRMMRDSNATIRSIAVQMASAYQDAPLKEEVLRLIEEEKTWVVRLRVIQAAGALRMSSLKPRLKNWVQSEKIPYEERQAAAEALLALDEESSKEEISLLAESNRAGLRYFACLSAVHSEVQEAMETIVCLVQDSHPDVRVAALNAIGLLYRNQLSLEKTQEILQEPLQESHSTVAITAAWVAMLVDPAWGEPFMEKWLQDALPENRRLAAAALATTGERGVRLALQTLQESRDPYVKINLVLGLLGQRVSVSKCADFVYSFLTEEKRMWMWEARANPLFQVLEPSQIRHSDQIPNYPEAMDQMTRLRLASLLVVVEDPRALEVLKQFLKQKKWGITGTAAAILLQEGDEAALEGVRQLQEDPDPHIRLQACLVLAFLGKDSAVYNDLVAAYPGGDHEQKLHILEALGRVSRPEIFQFLTKALEEPFPILRVAAAAALVQGLNH